MKTPKIMKFKKIEEKNSIAEKLKYPVMNAKYDLGFSFLIENAMNIDITSINVCRFLEILFGYFYFMCMFCVLSFYYFIERIIWMSWKAMENVNRNSN